MKASEGTTSSAGSVLGMLGELFGPAQKHTTEQQEHERLARPRSDAADPGADGPVDLDGNKARIRLPKASPDSAEEPG